MTALGVLDSTDPTPRLRVVRDEPGVELEAAERAVADLLVALGQDPTSERFAATPPRVAGSFVELLTPTPFTATTWPNDEGYDELVLARDIPLQSLCQHHLLPFTGVAHVAYLPAGRIVGLSKLACIIDHVARRLQVQDGSPARWRTGSTSISPPKASASSSTPSTRACPYAARTRRARIVTSTLRDFVRDDPALGKRSWP